MNPLPRHSSDSNLVPDHSDNPYERTGALCTITLFQKTHLDRLLNSIKRRISLSLRQSVCWSPCFHRKSADEGQRLNGFISGELGGHSAMWAGYFQITSNTCGLQSVSSFNTNDANIIHDRCYSLIVLINGIACSVRLIFLRTYLFLHKYLASDDRWFLPSDVIPYELNHR